MKQHQPVDSIAVFGSLARGDRDQMSDRDILVVSDDSNTRRSSIAKLRRAGWSPVAFSWKRLERAGARKGLFIQHLKLEAGVLRDKDRRLQDFFDGFCAKPQYDQEIEESRNLLGVLESVPDSQKGRYWALDVLGVGLRSIAVATLANHGIYHFSFNNILAGLLKIGVIKSGDLEILGGVREFKWRHRTQRFVRNLSMSDTQKMVDLVSRRFRIGLQLNTIQPDEALNAIAEDKGDRTNWYIRSRLLERGLLALHWSGNPEEELLSAKQQLQQLLKEPSQYGWRVKQRWTSLQEQIREIGAYSEVRF